jgi:hypothetical protein
MAKGKVLSDMLTQAGVPQALAAGGKLAEGVYNEAKDPGFWARTNPVTGPAAELKLLATDPGAEADRIRSGAAGVSLGASAKLEGLNRRLLGDPNGMASAEDATAKAVEKYPVENIAGNAVLPAGPELKGAGAGAKAIGRIATQGTYGGVNAAMRGDDPAAGVASGIISGGVGEGVGALQKPLYNASGKAFVKAVSPRAGIMDRLDREGIRAPDVSKLGHEFRQEGLVPLLGGREAALEAANARRAELGKAYPVLDQQFNDAVLQSRQASGGTVGGRPANAPASADTYNFRKSSTAAMPKGLNPEEKAAAGPATRFAERLAQGSGGLGDARGQMADARRNIDQRSKVPLREDLRRDAFDRAREDYYSQIREVLGPEKEAAQRAHDRRYAITSTAKDLAEPAVTREVLHQGVSPMGLGLAASHGGVKEALIEALTEQAVRRSAAPAAHGLYLGSLAAGAARDAIPAAARAAEDEQPPWLQYFNPRKK